MDNRFVTEAELAKERQKTTLLAQEIRVINQRIATASRASGEIVSDFPAGSLGQKYGTIGLKSNGRARK